MISPVSTPSLRISCKTVEPFCRNLADKEMKHCHSLDGSTIGVGLRLVSRAQLTHHSVLSYLWFTVKVGVPFNGTLRISVNGLNSSTLRNPCLVQESGAYFLQKVMKGERMRRDRFTLLLLTTVFVDRAFSQFRNTATATKRLQAIGVL